jgi:hypothetical protein
MTAGQNVGQLRRSSHSGLYPVIGAVVAGALAIGILVAVAARPTAVNPAAAAVPVPPIEFRLEEHDISTPVSAPALPAPSVQRQFQLRERGHAVSVNLEGSSTAWPKGR